MKKINKRWLSAIISVVMILTLCSCSGKKEESPAQPTQQSGSQTAESGSETAETGPVSGGDLTIIDTAEVTSMLWYKVQSYNDKFQTMLTCYETLFRTDESSQIDPWLANPTRPIRRRRPIPSP